MAVRRTTTARRRGSWEPAHCDQLQHGWDFFQEAWGDPVNPNPAWADEGEREADMAACWEEYREQIIAEHVDRFPATRPWAFWHFDHARDEAIHEEEQLHLLGLLTEQEIATREKRDGDGTPSLGNASFKRPWTWWRRHGGRDYLIDEEEQLAAMGELTLWEQFCRDARGNIQLSGYNAWLASRQ